MLDDFLNRLTEGPALFDGAMGSLLLAAGLRPGSAPEVWNTERPETIMNIHHDYVAAGAEVITTNTFGGTPLRMAAHGLAGRCEELNFAGVRLALAARSTGAGHRVFVAGDIGPCGKYFPPVGDLVEKTLADSLQTQMEILAAAGVDLLLIETMVDLREAEIAVRTARTVADIPVVATMTFDKKPRGYFTIMGHTPSDTVRRLADAGADMVGANCTLAAEEMVELADTLVKTSPLPVLIQPNAGQPEFVDGRAVYRLTPAAFAGAIKKILDTGVAAVGGCCGTTPDHIRAVSDILGHERKPSQD